tara:strand:- start:332 stop:601 length:270 start_codon:yes stop_codon:yes gene_type:complete
MENYQIKESNVDPKKLKTMTHTLIILNYKDHPLFNVFLHEWEYKFASDDNGGRVEELNLFDNYGNIKETIKFSESRGEQLKHYFAKIGF